MRAAILALALAACAGTPNAAPPQTTSTETEATPCGVEVPVTAALVRDAGDINPISALAGDVLYGRLSYMREPREAAEAASGGVLFFRGADARWRAVLPAPEESIVGLFLGRGLRDIIVVTQRQIGDPGQAFTFARSEDNFVTTTCAYIRFPAALNQPTWNGEFLELYDIDINASGQGVLIGSASTDRSGEGARTLWFAYDTRDGGRTWSTPRALNGQPPAPPGPFVRAAEQSAPRDLLAALQTYAATR